MARTRWRVALWLGMLAVVGYFLWSARAALLPFAVGGVIAYALSPLVERIAVASAANTNDGDPTTKRGLVVLLIYLVIGLLLFWTGSLIVPVAIDQVLEFIDTLPETLDAAREEGSRWLSQYRDRVPIEVQNRVNDYLDEASAVGANVAASMASLSLGAIGSTIGLLIGFAVTPFFVFYALRDRPKAGRNFLAAVPEEFRADAASFMAIADRLLLRFLRGQLLLGAVVGTVVGVGLTLMDVQLSLALGIIAGVTELIPIIGPWLGAIPGLIVVLATEPSQFVWVALLYFGVQMLENYLLVPRIQGGATELHPAMVLILLVAYGAVLGFWGLVLAVPLTAILRELFWYTDYRLRGLTPRQAFGHTHVARPEETREE
jgi:predicted PurR-regulated permease PerM